MQRQYQYVKIKNNSFEELSHGGVVIMTDYKAMYYYLAGRMATAVEALEATTNALVEITEKLKAAQQVTEEMFINASEEDLERADEE